MITLFDPLTDEYIAKDGDRVSRYNDLRRESLYMLSYECPEHDPSKNVLYDQQPKHSPDVMIGHEQAKTIIKDFCARHDIEQEPELLIQNKPNEFDNNKSYIMAAVWTVGGIGMAINFALQYAVNVGTLSTLMALCGISISAIGSLSAKSVYDEEKKERTIYGRALRSEKISLFKKPLRSVLGEQFNNAKPVSLRTLIHELCHIYISSKSGDIETNTHGPLFAHLLLHEMDHYDPTSDKSWSRSTANRFSKYDLTGQRDISSPFIELIPDLPEFANTILALPLPKQKPLGLKPTTRLPNLAA